MLVCACNPASPSYQANDLALLDHVPLLDQDPGLMPEAAVYPPAVVDDCSIPTYGHGLGEDHHTGCWRSDLQPLASAEIQPGVKTLNSGIAVQSVVGTACSIIGREAVRIYQYLVGLDAAVRDAMSSFSGSVTRGSIVFGSTPRMSSLG